MLATIEVEVPEVHSMCCTAYIECWPNFEIAEDSKAASLQKNKESVADIDLISKKSSETRQQ